MHEEKKKKMKERKDEGMWTVYCTEIFAMLNSVST